MLTCVGAGVDRLAWGVVAVVVVEVNFVEEEFEVPPVVEVDEPEGTPVGEVDGSEDIDVVVELSIGGVVIGEPLARVELAMQYHSLGFRLAQLMPVFQAERLAAGTPIMESRSSQLLFYAQCQLSKDRYVLHLVTVLCFFVLQRPYNAIRRLCRQGRGTEGSVCRSEGILHLPGERETEWHTAWLHPRRWFAAPRAT